VGARPRRQVRRDPRQGEQDLVQGARRRLRGNPLLADRTGIETLLRKGGIQMPAVGFNWTSGQIDALVAYTKRFATKGGTG
jgi:hypothetical protein